MLKQEVAIEGAKSAPPLSVVAADQLGAISVNKYVAMATLVYVIMQAAYLGWKWYKEYKLGKNK